MKVTQVELTKFHLWLFDLDGLLVDTEMTHLRAYQNMCRLYNCDLNWTFDEFIQIAHESAISIRHALLRDFPKLARVDWNELYASKKKCYLDLIKSGSIDLMPYADIMLQLVQEWGVCACVVTHSSAEQVKHIRSSVSELNSIHHWITREDYQISKPAPDAYKLAINHFLQKGDKAIGFEDSARGLTALLGSSAMPILVTPHDYPQLKPYSSRFIQIKSFLPLLEAQKNLPPHLLKEIDQRRQSL